MQGEGKVSNLDSTGKERPHGEGDTWVGQGAGLT